MTTAMIAVALYLVSVLGVLYFNYAASVVSGNK
jgi:hypothetical protein